MVVQVRSEKAVPWTKPVDFTIDPNNPMTAFVDSAQEHFPAGFCDGSVMPIRTSVTAKMLMALITINDKEQVVDVNKL